MAKVRKQFVLDAAKIRRARKVLGVSTDTAAVNEALDRVLAKADIAEIHRRLAGRLPLRDMDQSKFRA